MTSPSPQRAPPEVTAGARHESFGIFPSHGQCIPWIHWYTGSSALKPLRMLCFNSGDRLPCKFGHLFPLGFRFGSRTSVAHTVWAVGFFIINS